MNYSILLFICLIGSIYTRAQDTLSIFYASDVSSLSNFQKEKIKSFLELEKGVDSIRIESHTDDIGTLEYNLLLSQKRAIETANFIKEDLVESSKFPVFSNGKGEEEITTYTIIKKTTRQQCRRTDIFIFRSFVPDNQYVEEQTLDSNLLYNFELKNKSIILKNVLFEGGTSRFIPSSFTELDALALYLKQNPALKIRIIGHVCCTANKNEDGLNIETGLYNLSFSRAEKTFNFLVKKGISQDRMTYEGKKGAFPLGGKITEDRRVEIEIIN